MASARPALSASGCAANLLASRASTSSAARSATRTKRRPFLDANGAVGEHGEAVVAALCGCWASVVASLPSAATSAVASQVAKELMSASGLVASRAPAVTRLGPALAKVCINPERQTARTIERMVGRQLTAAACALGEPPVATALGLLCAPSGDGGAAGSGIGSLAASLAAAGLLAAARRCAAATEGRRQRRASEEATAQSEPSSAAADGAAPPEPPRGARPRAAQAGGRPPAAVVALARACQRARGGSLLHDDAEARLNDVLRALSLLAAARARRRATAPGGEQAEARRGGRVIS